MLYFLSILLVILYQNGANALGVIAPYQNIVQSASIQQLQQTLLEHSSIHITFSTIKTISSSSTISHLSQADVNGWYDADSTVDRNSFLYIILTGAFFFTLLINILPDVVRKVGENASVMEREKKVGKSRPSDKYKPLVERILIDWDNDNCDSFIIANYDKENTGDYCNSKGDNSFDFDNGLSIDTDGCDSVGDDGGDSGGGDDGGDSGGGDGGDCGGD